MSEATTKEVWEKSRNIYQRDNIQAKLNLEAQLYSLSYKDNEDIDKHLQKFSRMFVDLAALGVVYEEADKVGHLFRSLMESFVALSSTSGAIKWTFDQLVDEIKSNVDRRSRNTNNEFNNRKEEKSVTPGARKTLEKKKGNVQGDIECFYCHKMGHLAKDWRKRKRDRAASNRGRGREGSGHISGRSRGRGRIGYGSWNYPPQFPKHPGDNGGALAPDHPPPSQGGNAGPSNYQGEVTTPRSSAEAL